MINLAVKRIGNQPVTILVVALCACILSVYAFAGDSWNFDPPTETLHLHFWHHSTGGMWLSRGLRSALQAVEWDDSGVPTRSYLVSDYNYGGQNDYTYYVHWYKRFRTEVGVEGPDGHNYVYNKTQTPENEIADSNFMLTCYDYSRQEGETISYPERLDIVMFKPCYPGSRVYEFDTQYDGTGNVIGGTPWSDSNNTYTNFDYLDSIEGVGTDYTNDYWPETVSVPNSGGEWSSGTGGSRSSLAQIKVAYRGMLNIFHERPEVMWVALQAPPLNSMTSEEIASCRELARWFREDWLHEYDPTGTDTFQDYQDKNGRINVACFDYYNSMAYTGEDAALDAEFFWFPDSWSFPDEFNNWYSPHVFVQAGLGDNVPLTDPGADYNLPEYADREVGEGRNMDDSDNHPSDFQQYHATDIFVGLKRNPATQGYKSWINAVTNRGRGNDSIAVEITLMGTDEITLTWNSTPGISYEIYGGADPSSLTLLDTQSSEGTTTDWIDSNATGIEKFYQVTKP